MKIIKTQLTDLAQSLIDNFKKVNEIVEKLDEHNRKKSKRVQDFRKKHQELLIKNSKKDDKGNPITMTQGITVYYEIVDKEKHDKEFYQLEKRYKKDLEAQEAKEHADALAMKEEIEIELDILGIKI